MKCLHSFIVLLLMALTAFTQPGNPDSLRHVLKQQTTDTGKIQTLVRLGLTYEMAANDSALYYYKNALQLAEATGYRKGEVNARYRMGEFFFGSKENATALALYLENIEQAKNFNDKEAVFENTWKASFVFSRIGDFEKEYEYVKKMEALVNSGSLNGNKRITNFRNVVINRLSAIYINLNKPDSARHYAGLLYNYGQEKMNSNDITLGAIRFAELNDKLKLPDSSLFFYRIALSAASSAGRKDLYNSCMYHLGRLFWQKKHKDSAFYYTKYAFDSSANQWTPSLSPRMAAAGLLAEIYKAKQKPDSAYAFLRLHMQMKDTMFAAEKLARIQNISLRQSLQNMQLEQSKKEAVKEYQARIKIFGLAAGLLVLLFLAVVFYRNSRQRAIANNKLEKAYHELQATQAQLVQKEKMASLGELTAGIAHEIQNPLNFVNNFSEVSLELLEEAKEEITGGNGARAVLTIDEAKENLQKVLHHGMRADAIVKSMLQHSRTSAGEKMPTNINALADEYLRLSYHGFRSRDKNFNAALQTQFDSSIAEMNISPQDIGRVLLNMYNNAFYSVSEKKNVSMAFTSQRWK